MSVTSPASHRCGSMADHHYIRANQMDRARPASSRNSSTSSFTNRSLRWNKKSPHLAGLVCVVLVIGSITDCLFHLFKHLDGTVEPEPKSSLDEIGGGLSVAFMPGGLHFVGRTFGPTALG
jgi:hypothetical protein